MKVYKNGTKCILDIGGKEIPGTILQISIKGESYVNYEVSYYDDGVKSYWADDYEIKVEKGEKATIGFKV